MLPHPSNERGQSDVLSSYAKQDYAEQTTRSDSEEIDLLEQSDMSEKHEFQFCLDGEINDDISMVKREQDSHSEVQTNQLCDRSHSLEFQPLDRRYAYCPSINCPDLPFQTALPPMSKATRFTPDLTSPEWQQDQNESSKDNHSISRKMQDYSFKFKQSNIAPSRQADNLETPNQDCNGGGCCTTPELSFVTTPDSLFSRRGPFAGLYNSSGLSSTPTTPQYSKTQTDSNAWPSPTSNIIQNTSDFTNVDYEGFPDQHVARYEASDQQWLKHTDTEFHQELGQSLYQFDLACAATPRNEQTTLMPNDMSWLAQYEDCQHPSEIPVPNTVNQTNRSGHVVDSQIFTLPLNLQDVENLPSTTTNQFFRNTSFCGMNTGLPRNHLGVYRDFDFNKSPFALDEPNVGRSIHLLTNTYNTGRIQPIDQPHQAETNRSRAGGRDEEMDRKLVEWRNAGMSYKEIMARGNFGLEESTLRGRYRTLTKPKTQRLRRPGWDAHAVSSLIAGVEALAPPASRRSKAKEALDKIPWKKVAEWMERERGCYLYGNATVKKKYVEIINNKR